MTTVDSNGAPSTDTFLAVYYWLGGEALWCRAWVGGRAILEPISMLCVLIGTLIIAVRAPMIFAPSATLRFFDRLISTDAGIRGIGLVIAPFGLALVILARGEGATVGVLRALGWLAAAATVWLLAAPGSYRRLARGVLGYFESSADMAIMRIFGLVAVAIGVALIYVGIYVV